MVRGMPIIEGFTRMDKEACYRAVDDTEHPAIGGASSKPAASLVGKSSDSSSQVIPDSAQPVVANTNSQPVAEQSQAAAAKPLESLIVEASGASAPVPVLPTDAVASPKQAISNVASQTVLAPAQSSVPASVVAAAPPSPDSKQIASQ